MNIFLFKAYLYLLSIPVYRIATKSILETVTNKV